MERSCALGPAEFLWYLKPSQRTMVTSSTYRFVSTYAGLQWECYMFNTSANANRSNCVSLYIFVGVFESIPTKTKHPVRQVPSICAFFSHFASQICELYEFVNLTEETIVVQDSKLQITNLCGFLSFWFNHEKGFLPIFRDSQHSNLMAVWSQI